MIRLADIILSAVLLAISAPLFLVIATLIKYNDGGEIFFLQDRVGKDLKLFKIIKFRTMRPNLEGAGTIGANGSKLAARQAFKTTTFGDPRTTSIGRRLRRFHLDELPQLINVVKGEMSMVGVRPDTPAQEVDYEAKYWQTRHSLRPGITGTAQVKVSLRSLDERTQLEMLWVSRPTIFAYFMVLLGTMKKITAGSSL